MVVACISCSTFHPTFQAIIDQNNRLCDVNLVARTGQSISHLDYSENAFVYALNPTNSTWLGINKTAAGWTWAFGSLAGAPASTFWAAMQPSSDADATCAVVGSGLGGDWLNTLCSAMFGYVVEYECADACFTSSSGGCCLL